MAQGSHSRIGMATGIGAGMARGNAGLAIIVLLLLWDRASREMAAMLPGLTPRPSLAPLQWRDRAGLSPASGKHLWEAIMIGGRPSSRTTGCRAAYSDGAMAMIRLYLVAN